MSAEAWRRTGTDWAPLRLTWQAWHFQHLRLDLRGRRGTCRAFDRCLACYRGRNPPKARGLVCFDLVGLFVFERFHFWL